MISFRSGNSGKPAIQRNILERLKPDTYTKEGALWFNANKFDPSIEDYVLVKSDGQYSYVLVDIAYNAHKLLVRGFDRIIVVLGPDHHNHAARLQAAMKSLDISGKLEIPILQQVNLFEKGEKVMMSKRAGKIITMDVLMDDVGADVARFFFLTRRAEAHLDFDIDIAKSQTDDNPVYYVQYAYARLSNILIHAKNKGFDVDNIPTDKLRLSEEESSMLRKVASLPETLRAVSDGLSPHLLAFWLIDFAQKFHPFYFKYRVVSDDIPLTESRLILSKALKKVLFDALSLLGVNAPESM
jgi:arginyl-tRNA synthetase